MLEPLEVFAPVVGLPCWNVRRGISTFLTLEFGQPHLRVREPQPDHPGIDLLGMYRYRNITLAGEYHLRIAEVQWQILQDGAILGTEIDATFESAFRFLDGQILTRVKLYPERGLSVFSFDLGGALTTAPGYSEPDHEMWTLYDDHTGYTLTYRADGHYAYNPATTPPDEQIWLPAP